MLLINKTVQVNAAHSGFLLMRNLRCANKSVQCKFILYKYRKNLIFKGVKCENLNLMQILPILRKNLHFESLVKILTNFAFITIKINIMRLKITLLSLVTVCFTSVAQVSPVLQHNNLDNNLTVEDIGDMEIYNNEAYFSLPEEGKIVKVSLGTVNAPVVDVLTGLSNPSGLKFVGNELYFLQAANALFQNNTGKLCKINATQTNPAITTINSSLQFPIELAMNGTTAYVSEAYLVDGDVEHMEVSAVVGATKTVLYNNFDFLDDIEVYNNKLYLLNFDMTSETGSIKTLDITTNTPGTPQAFWTDTTELVPYKMSLSGSKMYLNMDSSPSSVMQLDLLNPSAPLITVANQFAFNGNTAYVNEMIVAPGNVMYAVGESYNMAEDMDHYLLYKIDLNLLGTANFERSASITSFPNPAVDAITLTNYENGKVYTVYALDGKQVLEGRYSGVINVTGLNAGMYIVKLENGSSIKISKK